MTDAAVPPTAGGTDPRQAIQLLEDRLARIPKASRPLEHATIAYRLGLAYAETPIGGQVQSLRKAIAHYEVASTLFDPERHPLEHARVLNAGGAAYRALDERRRAATLFEKAAAMMAEGAAARGAAPGGAAATPAAAPGADNERAAVLNNLGLVRSEMGQAALAVEACDQAAGLWDTSAGEGRRGLVATLHTRAAAHAAAGTEEGLEAALADYDRALLEIDPDEAPYHLALVHHSMGVARSSLAALRPGQRDTLLRAAIQSFNESLAVFTRTDFPFQHALAKHNTGLAWLALGGEDDRRRALVCFEDAVSMLDPRLHAEPWRQAYASLSRVEDELAAATAGAGVTRADQFAALVAASDPDERIVLLRERVTRFLAQPEPQRRSSLTEMAMASAQLGYDDARAVIEAELRVLMELPTEGLHTALRARLDAHSRLPEEVREEAAQALDQAVGDALQGPQRIAVRDFLYSIGYERP